jgi:hypothetical protein
MCQAVLIRGLEQSWFELPMHLDRATDNLSSQRVFFPLGVLRVLCGFHLQLIGHLSGKLLNCQKLFGILKR